MSKTEDEGDGVNVVGESKRNVVESDQQVKQKRNIRRVPRVNPLELMETIVEKLKLLNYEKYFCEQKSRKPFSRTHFAITPVPPENSSTLLASFLKLVAWLMEVCGRDFVLDKFDDPTTSVNKVMVDLKQMGFKMDFPALKLRQGFGDAVCIVLNFLCDRSLEKRGFAFKDKSLVYPDELEDNAEVDDEADIGEVDEDVAESSEEEIMYSQMLQNNKRDGETKIASPVKTLLENNTDVIKWKAELERVSSKLMRLSRHAASNAEWRSHIVTASTNGGVLRKVYPKVEVALKSIRESIRTNLDRVVSKEKYINSKFDSMQYQFRELQQKLNASQTRFQTTQDSVRDLSETLATISNRLEDLKEQQESKGSSMTDTAPLVRMKKALKKIEKEMKEMEIRIGVLSHTIMQSKMSEKDEESRGVDLDEDIEEDQSKRMSQDMNNDGSFADDSRTDGRRGDDTDTDSSSDSDF